jgi:simple sugar transport system substrate-binding protein/ribose transport system substrate-binding protein
MSDRRVPGWLAAALAASGLALSGCGPGAEPGRLKIAGIVFQEDQFFRLVLSGMREAAGKAGAELLEADSNNKPDKEAELVNTYIARKVDAIVISPQSRKGSVAALRLAHEKGIRVVCHNTPIDADFPAATVESSQADLGEQTGRAARAFIEAHLGGKAKVAILAFKSQVPEQSDARVGGFKKEISRLPGAEIVAEQDAWLPEAAVRKAGDILTAHPGVNVLYSANEGGTVGCVMAVRNAGKAGRVAVFGTDVSEQILDLLGSPEGILQAVTAQRPVEAGRLAVEAALKALKGEAVEKAQSLPGECLSRTDPEGVKAYAAKLKGWMGKAAN